MKVRWGRTGNQQMRKFCIHQIKCSDTPKGIWDCAAHLAEARLPVCSYKESDITAIEDGKLRIPSREKSPYRCADFEPTKEIVAKFAVTNAAREGKEG